MTVPGGIDKVEFRAQDPRGAYGGARLALRRGSYPNGADEVAVTDGVATLLGLEIGQTIALDGRRRTVVGIVENPPDLSDEFALVSPSSAGRPDHVTALLDADAGAVDALIAELGNRSAFVGSVQRRSNRGADALAMFSVATVFLLLATLVAAAGFAVIAQRRLRQLGMLAAIGATGKQLRLVLLTNGAVVGAIGALLGTIAGLALWVALVPTLEPAFGHRIDRLEPAVGAARDGRPRRRARGDRRSLVARASGGARPGHARPLGATAQAEAGTSLGDRRRRA